MTDFLHPQNVATPDVHAGDLTPREDHPVTGSIPVPEAKSIPLEVKKVPDVADLEIKTIGAVEKKSDKNNFHKANVDESPNGNNQKENDDQGHEGDREDVKKIVRNESPIFIHYYQSVFLVLIMLFVASGYLVLSPLITEFKKTNQSIGAKLNEKVEAESFLQSINNSISAAQSIPPETLERINESLPNEVQVPILLKTFANIAAKNGVKMGGIQISASEPSSDSAGSGGYALVPIRVAVSISAPGYLVMRRYLEDLQLYVRLMDVKSISVSGDDNSGEFSYSLDLTTYYLKKAAVSSAGGRLGGVADAPSAPMPSVNEN
jgi:hypothetical protein